MRQLLCAAYLAAMPLAMINPPSAFAVAITADFTATDLAAEEGKFAAYSVKHGMRAAFIEFFAEKSWLLRPDPVDAQTWLKGRPDAPIVLDWKSQRTILSSSRDMGFSTGPSIIRRKPKPDTPDLPAAHGNFFSVWQKQTNGTWKVLVDHGISNEPTATPNTLSAMPLIALDLPAQKTGTDLPAEDAEQQFIAAGKNIHAAYEGVTTAETRLLRDGQFPIDGKAAITDFLKSQEGHWSWTVILNGKSRANDFAYAVGNYHWQPKDGRARKGKYVRVWVRDVASASPRWTLAGDVLTPDPPPKS